MYEYRAQLVRIVDGDTLVMNIDLGLRTFRKDKLRLVGVNTPEIFGVKKDSLEYEDGIRAKQFVEDWFETYASAFCIVRTEKDRTGKYGRWLAKVYQADFHGTGVEENGRCLNDDLSREGWADI